MRRVVLKSPVLENCTPGSVRGAPGNRRPYLAIMGISSALLCFVTSLDQRRGPLLRAIEFIERGAVNVFV
jgi:hypothetical protein